MRVAGKMDAPSHDSRSSSSSGAEDSKVKAAFMAKATTLPNPLAHQAATDDDVMRGLGWIAKRTAEQEFEQREEAITAIEAKAAALQATSAAQKWFDGSGEAVRVVASCVNGPLLEWCFEQSRWSDVRCAEVFRTGGPVVGELPGTGAN